MKYFVKLSNEAQTDFDNYIDHIMFEYAAPLTATQHHDEIIEELFELSQMPYKYSIRHNTSLRQYGIDVRRANYKKMAIIYTIHHEVVYIHRIIASSMITDL